jgi:hypothetical protein
MTDPERAQIDRINEISAIARTSWLALLGYLAFIECRYDSRAGGGGHPPRRGRAPGR